MVCNHFHFTCSSVTSNIEPLGKEKALLKAFFFSLVLPKKRQQTLWLHPPWNKCSAVFNTIKKKMKDKGEILSFQCIWAAALLVEVVNFSSISQCSLPTPDLSLPCIQKLHFQSPVFFSTPYYLTLCSEIKADWTFRVSSCVEGNSSVPSWVFLHKELLFFDSYSWKTERRFFST